MQPNMHSSILARSNAEGKRTMLAKNILYYGIDKPLPQQIPLRAGPLSLIYENGDLRYITLGATEILRRVYVAVRDRNWSTVPPQFSNVEIEQGEDAFHIRYTVQNVQGEIDFAWQGEIMGAADGVISFRMDGEARSAFLRNRIGFCLLHPMGVAGAPARIEHTNGRTEVSVFPIHIAPQMVVNGEIKPMIPFNEMRAVAHEVAPGLWAEVRFSGDIFETEDQRNWTDASYKTYSTPLRLPFPAQVQQGDKIAQSLMLRLVDAPSGPPPTTNDERQMTDVNAKLLSCKIVPDGQVTMLPRLGLGVASHGQPLSQTELARLQALKLAHLRVDLKLAQPDYAALLRQATTEARALAVRLEVALHLTNAAADELSALAMRLAEIQPPVATWLIFHEHEKTTTAPWIDLARTVLAEYDPAAQFGAGTNVYFTELNRSRPPVQALDQVAYSINPQVHAFDNSSLVETLAAQAATVFSTRQFIGELPLAISPVTLQPRFNPNATGPEPTPAPGALPAQVDSRQMSLFGAAWTLGSIKYLAETGQVASVTYYETTGWRGVMETAAGSPLPEKFPSIPGAVFPLYHTLADVGDFAGGEVIPLQSSDPLRVDGLLLQKDDQRRLLLANLRADPQTVTVEGLGAQVKLRVLDETNVEEAMQSPETFRRQAGEAIATARGTLEVTLLPYAVARIDSTSNN
jgi:D-apionolactonase